jgi:hypothetical protein
LSDLTIALAVGAHLAASLWQRFTEPDYAARAIAKGQAQAAWRERQAKAQHALWKDDKR